MDFSMIKQAQELKSKLDKAQKELANMTVEAGSGGGAIKIIITGNQQVKSVTISPKVVDPEKIGHLEELVLKAINEAINKSQKMAAKNLKSVTGGLKIPGL